MAQSPGNKLDSGDVFPDLALQLAGGGTRKISQLAAGQWSVVLFYRGDWCRYCRQQLADYQTWLPDLKQLGIAVIAASVDTPEEALKTVAAQKLAYPVAHSLDYQDISRRTGAFIEHERKILHATGFLLKPDLKIHVASYSTGPIGRLTPNDVSSLVRLALAKTSVPQGDRSC
ncbi:MAG: peroxiredoxin family protein [Burkholderiales bacterium]|nr:peroxiredoxin family protein [Burkholderiales bacterium]